MNVVFTDQAHKDLDRIWSYIEQDNPTRAIQFVREFNKRCLRLRDMPLRFQLVVNHEVSGIRRMPHGHYAIYYRVVGETVFILHILNAAQDHEAILFPEA